MSNQKELHEEVSKLKEVFGQSMRDENIRGIVQGETKVLHKRFCAWKKLSLKM